MSPCGTGPLPGLDESLGGRGLSRWTTRSSRHRGQTSAPRFVSTSQGLMWTSQSSQVGLLQKRTIPPWGLFTAEASPEGFRPRRAFSFPSSVRSILACQGGGVNSKIPSWPLERNLMISCSVRVTGGAMLRPCGLKPSTGGARL